MNESRELGKGIALSARSELIAFPCEMSVLLPRYVNSERENCCGKIFRRIMKPKLICLTTESLKVLELRLDLISARSDVFHEKKLSRRDVQHAPRQTSRVGVMNRRCRTWKRDLEKESSEKSSLMNQRSIELCNCISSVVLNEVIYFSFDNSIRVVQVWMTLRVKDWNVSCRTII